MPPRQKDEPRGHDFRVSRARHRPEASPLRVCDIAWLLDLSRTAVCDRDHQLKPAMVGIKGTKERRYSWAGYLAYVESVST